MKPVYQMAFGNGDGSEGLPCGNCIAACIASIFELPIEDIPHFVMIDATGGGCWNDQLNEWLEPYNLQVFFLDKDTYISKDVYCIGTGVTSRGIRHSVVCRGTTMVWDPVPFLEPEVPEFEYFLLFISKDPAKHK